MGSAASIKYRFKKKRTKNVFTCKLDGYDYDNQYPTCEYAYTRNFRHDNFTMTNDIIRFSPFCSNENMRFSYILIISLECNKSR